MEPIDSPISLNTGGISAYQFNAGYERSVITTPFIQDLTVTNAKIGGFQFNKGTGGTLTLGGSANGNGQLLIKDSGGTVKVQGDNAGLHIYGGSITIENKSSGTAVDSLGIVSITGFGNAQQITGGANQTFSSTAEVGVNNSQFTFTTARDTNLLFAFSANMYLIEPGTTSYAYSILRLNVDGSVTSSLVMHPGNDQKRTYSNQAIATLPSGTHTANLSGQLTSVSGSASMYLADWSLLYIKLGT